MHGQHMEMACISEEMFGNPDFPCGLPEWAGLLKRWWLCSFAIDVLTCSGGNPDSPTAKTPVVC